MSASTACMRCVGSERIRLLVTALLALQSDWITVLQNTAGVKCLQAMYHGKPVLAVPFFGDQLSNADRVVAKVKTVYGMTHMTATDEPSKPAQLTCCTALSGAGNRPLLTTLSFFPNVQEAHDCAGLWAASESL